MPSEHEGHRVRLKHRFLKTGIDDFEPHNILELLLFYSVPRKDTNPLAHRLIEHFGSFSAVLDAKPEELMKVKGVTENTAVLLSMIPGISRRYLEEKADAVNAVGGFKDIGDYFLPKFIGRKVETVMLASLDNKNKVVSCSIVAEGESDSAQVSKRRVIEEAIKVNAKKVVLAHNHPMGFAIPLAEDVDMTEEIYMLLKSVGIDLIDHIVVAEDDFVSMAASGIFFRKNK